MLCYSGDDVAVSINQLIYLCIALQEGRLASPWTSENTHKLTFMPASQNVYVNPSVWSNLRGTKHNDVPNSNPVTDFHDTLTASKLTLRDAALPQPDALLELVNLSYNKISLCAWARADVGRAYAARKAQRRQGDE